MNYFILLVTLFSLNSFAHKVEMVVDSKEVEDLVRLGLLYTEKNTDKFNQKEVKEVLKNLKESSKNKAIDLAVDNALKKGFFDKVTFEDVLRTVEKMNYRRVEKDDDKNCFTKDELMEIMSKALGVNRDLHMKKQNDR